MTLGLERLRELVAEADDPAFQASVRAEVEAQGLPFIIEDDAFYDLIAAGLEEAERRRQQSDERKPKRTRKRSAA